MSSIPSTPVSASPAPADPNATRCRLAPRAYRLEADLRFAPLLSFRVLLQGPEACLCCLADIPAGTVATFTMPAGNQHVACMACLAKSDNDLRLALIRRAAGYRDSIGKAMDAYLSTGGASAGPAHEDMARQQDLHGRLSSDLVTIAVAGFMINPGGIAEWLDAQPLCGNYAVRETITDAVLGMAS